MSIQSHFAYVRMTAINPRYLGQISVNGSTTGFGVLIPSLRPAGFAAIEVLLPCIGTRRRAQFPVLGGLGLAFGSRRERCLRLPQDRQNEPLRHLFTTAAPHFPTFRIF